MSEDHIERGPGDVSGPAVVTSGPEGSGPELLHYSSTTEGHALRYEATIDLAEKNTSHAQVISLTGRGKKVLEVGPATGSMTRVLQELDCRVTCIEVDPVAAEVAQKYSERMIVGSIEEMDLSETLPGEEFDVVIFSDVLEHLVDPAAVLRAARPLLAPGGYVCSSIPNVAHGSIRLALLTGRFNYTELGLLDRTHLRFFTREGMAELFSAGGFEIAEWRRVEVDIFSTELGLRAEDYPKTLVDSVREFPDYTTYQYVLRAEPVKQAGAETAASGEDSPVMKQTFAPMWELESRAAGLAESNLALEKDLAARNVSLYAAESELLALRHEHDILLNSVSYKLWQRLMVLMDRAAPWGTSRRRLLLLPGYAVRVLLEQGPRTMLLKVVKIWEWGPDLVRGTSGRRRRNDAGH